MQFSFRLPYVWRQTGVSHLSFTQNAMQPFPSHDTLQEKTVPNFRMST